MHGIYASHPLHFHHRRHLHTSKHQPLTTSASIVINRVIFGLHAPFVQPLHIRPPPSTGRPFPSPNALAFDHLSLPPDPPPSPSQRRHPQQPYHPPHHVVPSTLTGPASTHPVVFPTSAPLAEVSTLLTPALRHHPLKSLVPATVTSPVIISHLASLLQHHPDSSLVSFLLSGFHFGFSLGVHGSIRSGSLPNLVSCRSNQLAVSNAIDTEISRGHSHGPFPFPPFFPYHAAPIGIVSKKSCSFPLILYLSTNQPDSVNEGIDIDEFSVTYCSLHNAVALVHAACDTPFMSKLDAKHILPSLLWPTFRLAPSLFPLARLFLLRLPPPFRSPIFPLHL